jgi:hypothetical protein
MRLIATDPNPASKSCINACNGVRVAYQRHERPVARILYQGLAAHVCMLCCCACMHAVLLRKYACCARSPFEMSLQVREHPGYTTVSIVQY